MAKVSDDKLQALGFADDMISQLKPSAAQQSPQQSPQPAAAQSATTSAPESAAAEQNYKGIINGFKDDSFGGSLENLNQAIGKKLSSYTRGKIIGWQTLQQRKFAFLNKVKDEIGKIPVKTDENPQGRLSEGNINKLKMTIVVWKVLSMTPVRDNLTNQLPDQYLVESVMNSEHDIFEKYLDMIMEVLDNDEKWDFLTQDIRLDDGNLYLLDFSRSGDNITSPTKSLLIFINEKVIDGDTKDNMLNTMASYFDNSQGDPKTLLENLMTGKGTAAQSGEGGMFENITGFFSGGRKLRKTKKKKANKKKNRKTRSKKSKNQRKKK